MFIVISLVLTSGLVAELARRNKEISTAYAPAPAYPPPLRRTLARQYSVSEGLCASALRFIVQPLEHRAADDVAPAREPLLVTRPFGPISISETDHLFTKQLLYQLSYASVIQRVVHGDKRRPEQGSGVIFPEPVAADEGI